MDITNHKWGNGANSKGGSEEIRGDGIVGVSKEGNIVAKKEENKGAS